MGEPDRRAEHERGLGLRLDAPALQPRVEITTGGIPPAPGIERRELVVPARVDARGAEGREVGGHRVAQEDARLVLQPPLGESVQVSGLPPAVPGRRQAVVQHRGEHPDLARSGPDAHRERADRLVGAGGSAGPQGAEDSPDQLVRRLRLGKGWVLARPRSRRSVLPACHAGDAAFRLCSTGVIGACAGHVRRGSCRGPEQKPTSCGRSTESSPQPRRSPPSPLSPLWTRRRRRFAPTGQETCATWGSHLVGALG